MGVGGGWSSGRADGCGSGPCKTCKTTWGSGKVQAQQHLQPGHVSVQGKSPESMGTQVKNTRAVLRTGKHSPPINVLHVNNLGCFSRVRQMSSTPQLFPKISCCFSEAVG